MLGTEWRYNWKRLPSSTAIFLNFIPEWSVKQKEKKKNLAPWRTTAGICSF
jgi:hypothetical protein